jgi:hypothetical protein
MVPSAAEFMRVNSATVREGNTHRVWPPEVLRQFQMAEVVSSSFSPGASGRVVADVN